MCKLIILWLSMLAAVALVSPAYSADADGKNLSSDEAAPADDKEGGRNIARGLLPQLAIALRVPEGMKLFDPDGPQPPDESVEYGRIFPLGGEEIINRGYSLPLPFGLSIIAVSNVQDQSITDVSVALGKGVLPPEDAELRPVPPVSLDSNSDTQSVQIKADLWVLPFLNVYASIGRVTGEVDLLLNIDLADAGEICRPDPRPPGPGNPPRPPICMESDLSGSFLIPIQPQVSRTTGTLGLTGAYNIDKWFVSFSGSYSNTSGDKSTDISSISAGVRAGRRLVFGRGNLLAPYLGIAYSDIDTRVQGTTALQNAFPDGDSVDVRYDIQLENVDKYAGVLGLNMGFSNGFGAQFEFNKSARSERLVLTGLVRF
jgi:hypothetical protein